MKPDNNLSDVIAAIMAVPNGAGQAAVKAAQDAKVAKEAAEQAAELAAQRSFAVTEDGEDIIFTSTVAANTDGEEEG